MKKLLLAAAALFASVSMMAASITVDFSTATGLPTEESENVSTATIDGVDFSFYYCKQGTYSNVSYLQLAKSKSAYVSFSSQQVTKSLTIHTNANASTSTEVQLYAGETAIGEAVTLDATDADFSWNIPEANQAAGTVYKFVNTSSKNTQITKLVISDAAVVEEPEEPWNPTLGASTDNLDVNDAQNITGTEIEATSNAAKHIEPLESLELGSYKFTFTSPESGSKSAYYWATAAQEAQGNTDKTIRVYNNCTMTVTAPEGAIMRTITFEGNNAAAMTQITANSGDVHAEKADATSFEWAGETNAVTFSFKGKYRIRTIKVTYDQGTATPAAATPTFSKEAGTFTEPFALTISAAEGAKIYYTLDGSTPTTDSDLYSAPISISKTTTVRAIATEEGKRTSDIATATYTLEVAYATLSELMEAGLANTSEEVKYSGKATVVYQNGQYLYLQDATAAFLAYGNLSQEYKPGDVITGFSGKMTTYNNLNELKVTAASFAAPVETVEAPQPEVFDVEDVTAEDQNKYVIINNVKLVATTTGEGDDAKTTYTLVDAKDADLIAYPRFTGVEFPADDKSYNVVGLLSIFKDDLQIYPISFTETVGVEAIELGEGAAIYYNLQGQRVANPAKGQLLIKVQAEKASKVIF